jgi:hypothetical protein
MTPVEAAEACFAVARMHGMSAGLTTFVELSKQLDDFSVLALDLYLGPGHRASAADAQFVDYVRDWIKSADRVKRELKKRLQAQYGIRK